MSLDKKHAVVVLVRGLPGSGKSYIVERFIKKYGDGQFISLDPDQVDKNTDAYKDHVAAQTAEGVDPALYLYRFLRVQAYDGIRGGKTVIWNQPFSNRDIFKKMTGNFYLQAKEHGVDLELLIVEVSLDPEKARARVKSRKEAGGFGPDDATFDRFVSDYSTVADEYNVLSVDGEHADEAVELMKARIGSLR